MGTLTSAKETGIQIWQKHSPHLLQAMCVVAFAATLIFHPLFLLWALASVVVYMAGAAAMKAMAQRRTAEAAA